MDGWTDDINNIIFGKNEALGPVVAFVVVLFVASLRRRARAYGNYVVFFLFSPCYVLYSTVARSRKPKV